MAQGRLTERPTSRSGTKVEHRGGDKDLKDVYVELSFMNDPYNENPHLLLTGIKK